MNRRAFLLTGGIGAAVLAAASAGFAYGLPTGTAKPQATSTGPRKTAQVTRQTLADTESKNGTLGYGSTTSVSSKLNGTLTHLAEAGSTVQRGQTLFKVDELPVVLMYGALPLYRPLRSGMESSDADVKQFTENLKALGFSGFTSSAIKKWQKSLGLEQTGVVEPGRIVYAPGPVRIDSVSASIGDAAPGQTILSYTGTRRVVTTSLDVDDARLATVGAAVKVTLPDGKALDGKVESAKTTVQPGQNGGDPTTEIDVVIGLGDAAVALEKASVKIAFTASVREKVLTVPVAALLALREGGYGVELVSADGSSRVIAVKTGLFAAGRVEVSGDGLTEGGTVGMPS
ncbi:efflux RND transporter periplasmic adaptor subunit [Allorhizocola rhizosphaerae]|uniref:efflux RND transporter periplasmic adaptor subunit n=1 Tax=Allorhizocola rhizosphaerae TaxID=1872709 RepID=UPI000E3EB6D9|nr:efflux RND transporter periplasmic adaptor subunit [Allorhizocola rhizosphaerae]